MTRSQPPGPPHGPDETPPVPRRSAESQQPEPDDVPLAPLAEGAAPQAGSVADEDAYRSTKAPPQPARPQPPAEPAEDDEDEDLAGGYKLGAAVDRSRLSRSAMTVGDPRASRSLDDLVIGRPGTEPQRRWVAVVALLVIVAAGVSIALFLSDGSDGPPRTVGGPGGASQAAGSGRMTSLDPQPVNGGRPAQPDPQVGQRPAPQPAGSTADQDVASRQPAAFPIRPNVSGISLDAPRTPPGNGRAQDSVARTGTDQAAADPAEPATADPESPAVDPPRSTSQRPRATYIVGWDESKSPEHVFEFVGDAAATEPEEPDESQSGPRRPLPGDRLAVLPGWTSSVRVNNGSQTVDVTVLGGSVIEFAAPERQGDSDPVSVLELVAGRIVLKSPTAEGSSLKVRHRSSPNRPVDVRFTFRQPNDVGGVEIVRLANPPGATQLRSHTSDPPQSAQTQNLTGSISLGTAAPWLPAWVTAASSADESPLEDVFSSADMQPGVQPFTRVLKLELIDRLEASLKRIESEIRRNQNRRPGTNPRARAAQLKAAQLRDEQRRLTTETLKFLQELPPSDADPQAPAGQPEATEAQAESDSAPKRDGDPADAESQPDD